MPQFRMESVYARTRSCGRDRHWDRARQEGVKRMRCGRLGKILEINHWRTTRSHEMIAPVIVFGNILCSSHTDRNDLRNDADGATIIRTWYSQQLLVSFRSHGDCGSLDCAILGLYDFFSSVNECSSTTDSCTTWPLQRLKCHQTCADRRYL